MAAGLLERITSPIGHELVRVTDAGIMHLANATERNRSARSTHENLVHRVVEAMVRDGRIVWTGLSVRVPAFPAKQSRIPDGSCACPMFFPFAIPHARNIWNLLSMKSRSIELICWATSSALRSDRPISTWEGSVGMFWAATPEAGQLASLMRCQPRVESCCFRTANWRRCALPRKSLPLVCRSRFGWHWQRQTQYLGQIWTQ